MYGWRYFKVGRKHPNGTKVIFRFYSVLGSNMKRFMESLYLDARVITIEELYYD